MKILVLDIENSFIIGGVWGLWGQNISLDQLFDNGKMLCWSAKWLDDKTITYRNCYDVGFLEDLWVMLDDADAVLTYNGRRHDLPMINREFIKEGFGPPSPYKHIDLLETVKKHFKFPSNKMAHILNELEEGSKLDHDGFEMWVKCLEGDKKAWAKMKQYNIRDVKMLERLYYRFRPWISSHPNHSLFAKNTVCPYCGSKHIQSRGTYKTNVGEYRRMFCNDCGGWSRTRLTEIDLETRRKIIVPVTNG